MKSIMIVDDIPANVRLLGDLLQRAGYEVRPTTSPIRALEAAQTAAPDLFLLDVNMPELNGFDLCLQLKKNPDLAEIPVIFISALNEKEDILNGFHVGGVDYITKPFNSQEVLARVRTHIELQQRRQEVEILRQRDVAHYLDLLKLKDDVLRMVSHDLKNPLSIISGFAELVDEMIALDDINPVDAREMLSQIRKASQRMLQFVTDLLDTVRLEGHINLQLFPLQLDLFLQEVADELLFNHMRDPQKLRYEPGAGEARVQLDSGRFEQVIQNLVSNAYKYSTAEATITIRTRVEEGYAVVEIVDTGFGIPAADLPFLFDKFYRVQAAQYVQKPGTGLGLTIVQSIVGQHNGRIHVSSVEGKGSTFSILLPIVPE